MNRRTVREQTFKLLFGAEFHDLAEMDEKYGGIAVVAESPSELASGIVKCLSDKEACGRMAERALDVVKKHFSLEVNASKLFASYNQIAGEKK